VALAAGAWSACTASIAEGDREPGAGDPSAPGGAGSPGKGAAGSPGGGGTAGAGGQAGGGSATPAPAGADRAGPMPLRRLTRIEYRNTIRDLQIASSVSDVTRDIPEDTKGAFGFDAAPVVSNLEVDRFLGAAEAIGKALVASSTRFGQVLGCNAAAMGEDACARQFVTSFGRRAYRRPLAPDEIDALFAYYKSARTELRYDFPNGIRMVLQVMLQSPSFLYRWELGAQTPRRDGALVKLSSHETAARLSYFLWSSMPDAALFGKADAGGLEAPAAIAAEAARMIKDAKARDTIARFHDLWLGIEDLASVQKDPKISATFRPVLDALGGETRAFINHVFAEAGGSIETMLAAPYSFVNETIARHYGVSGVVGRDLRRVDLDPAQRLGLLTHGAFLAVHAPPNSTSPVRRGKVVLEHLLCDPPPPPPEGLDVMPPIPDPKLQAREQFAQHTTEPSCRACHLRMDMIGFAFEGYDTLGRFRTEEAGRPLDTTVTIPGLDGAERRVKGATELARILARSDQVRQCMVRQWMRFALGRLEVPDEAGSVRAALDEFAAAGFDLRALMVALTKTKAFTHRTPFSWEAP
jgi:hypothetical protein